MSAGLPWAVRNKASAYRRLMACAAPRDRAILRGERRGRPRDGLSITRKGSEKATMTYVGKCRIPVLGVLLAAAALTAACETAAEREARLEREAYVESLDVEELKNQLETVNPDPYDPKSRRTINRGRLRRN